MVKHIQDKTDFEKYISENQYVLIDFWATWCGPCLKIAPLVEKLAEEHKNVAFAKVDVDACEELSEMLNITAMPTFQIYKDGKLHKEWKGANDSKLVEELKNLK
jgi:thioredoxin 1